MTELADAMMPVMGNDFSKSSYLRNNSQGHLWGSIQLAGLLKSTVRQPFPEIVLYHAPEITLRYTDIIPRRQDGCLFPASGHLPQCPSSRRTLSWETIGPC